MALVGTGGFRQIHVDVVKRMPAEGAVRGRDVRPQRKRGSLNDFCDRNGMMPLRLLSVEDLVRRNDIGMLP